MNAKDTAIQLADKMYYSTDEDGFYSMSNFRAKQCALIAVDEILNIGVDILEFPYRFWQEVKQEIEKL